MFILKHYFHLDFGMISQQISAVSEPILAFQNIFHQLQRSENPSFQLLSMSKLRGLSIDKTFLANPMTSFTEVWRNKSYMLKILF